MLELIDELLRTADEVRDHTYHRCQEPSYLTVQVTVVVVRFELSQRANKKTLAAHSFHAGAGLRFLVTLGVAKCPHTVYRWLHSRLHDLADYQVD